MKNPTVEDQTNIEIVFSKHQLLEVLSTQFDEISDQHNIEEQRSFINAALVHMYLHRQASPEVMVGILSPKYGEPQEVADALMVLAEMDYIDFDTKFNKFVVVFDIDPDVQAKLDRYQYPMPMITPPRNVESNFDTGYETIKGTVVLNGDKYFNDKDVCLDHLNRANSVALSIDFEVINSVDGKYQKPTRKHEETFTEFQKRQRQHRIFFDTSVEVMEGLNNLTDVIYLTHKVDRRGRTYASGYHVNTQGTDWNKAVLQFANKELVK